MLEYHRRSLRYLLSSDDQSLPLARLHLVISQFRLHGLPRPAMIELYGPRSKRTEPLLFRLILVEERAKAIRKRVTRMNQQILDLLYLSIGSTNPSGSIACGTNMKRLTTDFLHRRPPVSHRSMVSVL